MMKELYRMTGAVTEKLKHSQVNYRDLANALYPLGWTYRRYVKPDRKSKGCQWVQKNSKIDKHYFVRIVPGTGVFIMYSSPEGRMDNFDIPYNICEEFCGNLEEIEGAIPLKQERGGV